MELARSGSVGQTDVHVGNMHFDEEEEEDGDDGMNTQGWNDVCHDRFVQYLSVA